MDLQDFNFTTTKNRKNPASKTFSLRENCNEKKNHKLKIEEADGKLEII